jgi:membrane protein involved in colicin uptake
MSTPLKLGDDPALRAQREANLKTAQGELEKLTQPHEANRSLNIDLATKKEADDLKTATKAREAVTGRMEAFANTIAEQKTLGKKFSIMGRIFPGRAGTVPIIGVQFGGVKKEYTRAAEAIRRAAKEKSNKDKLADAAAALTKENADAEEAAKKAATTPPVAGSGTSPAGGTPPTP